LVVLSAGLLGGCATPPFTATATGGIIAWSPNAEAARHEIAGRYCAQYGKMHRITSNHRRYGDYIGFACYWPRGYNPHEVRLRTSN